MNKTQNKYFYFALALLIGLVFFSNFNHLNQQGTYEDIFKPIAQNMLAGKGYTCDRLGGGPLFYPLWGYTALVAIDIAVGANGIFLLALQAILCWLAIFYFYKIFAINKSYWHLLFFLPFIALCSVKWPDAIAGPMLIFFIYYIYKYISNPRKLYLILAGVTLGITANMRSEYIYLPLVLMVFSIIPKLSGHKKRLFYSASVSLLIALLMLSTWAIRSYILTGEPRLSSTNGGAVLYICLGQLPNNPWHIAAIDKSAYDFAIKKGEKNPYSPKMDKALSKEFKRLIAQHPAYYMQKCAYNAGSSLVRGVYTGEFANAFISKYTRNRIDSLVTLKSGQISKFKYLLQLDNGIAIPMIIEKIIQALFIPIFFLLILAFIIIYFKKNLDVETGVLLGLILALVVYKYITISAIQYEYRHMNSIYLLLLGAVMRYKYYNIKTKRNPSIKS